MLRSIISESYMGRLCPCTKRSVSSRQTRWLTWLNCKSMFIWMRPVLSALREPYNYDWHLDLKTRHSLTSNCACFSATEMRANLKIGFKYFNNLQRTAGAASTSGQNGVVSDLEFSSLELSANTQKAIAEMGFVKMMEIQAKSIPPLLQGRDVLGAAKTGRQNTTILFKYFVIYCRSSVSKTRLLCHSWSRYIMLYSKRPRMQIRESW